jgi:polyphosphate glucokinase
MSLLGIDIGRTAIKSGMVTITDHVEIDHFETVTIPQTSRYHEYLTALIRLLKESPSYQMAGIGFPSVIRENRIYSKDLNFDGIWLEIQSFMNSIHLPCYAINDADAAGIAEIANDRSGHLHTGVTVVITLGTGIGSAIFLDGKLLPNTELGQLQFHGIMSEDYAAPSVRIRESLSIQEWALRLQEYLTYIDVLLAPDHIVLGGGISADYEIYKSCLETKAELLPAQFRNQAGVIGAAVYASQRAQGVVDP